MVVDEIHKCRSLRPDKSAHLITRQQGQKFFCITGGYHHKKFQKKGAQREDLHPADESCDFGAVGKGDGKVTDIAVTYGVIEMPFLSAPYRRLRHTHPSHDLAGAMDVRLRKHNPGSPDELARCVAVTQQSLKLGAISGAKVKADDETNDARNIAYQGRLWESSVRRRTLAKMHFL